MKGATIELYEKGKRDKPLASETLSLSRLFNFNVPISKEYVIRVVPKKTSGKTFMPKEEIISFKKGDPSLSSRFTKIELEEVSRPANNEINGGQVVGPIVVFSFLLVLFNIDSLKERFGKKE
jgi:hypothetical protein